MHQAQWSPERPLPPPVSLASETRFALGEFDSANPWGSLGSETLESAANQAMALKAAQESIVLLKNEKADANDAAPLLPIAADKKVALIGPYANQIMLGD